MLGLIINTALEKELRSYGPYDPYAARALDPIG
jgi:hypothetical protein